MAWLVFVVKSQGIILAPVYWNSTNPMFKTSKNLHTVEVNLFDEIDFVCPYYPRGSDDALVEYYIIYQVTLPEYIDCNIYSDNSAAMIVNCSNPTQRKRFTLLFESFQSIPNVPEYTPGSSYYYITTSLGPRDGLMNLNLGACYYNNMKLIIRVCCDSNLLQSSSLPDLTIEGSSKSDGKDVNARVKNSHELGDTVGDFMGTRSKKLETTDVFNEDEEEPRHQGLSDSADVIRQHGSDVGILLLSLTTVAVSNISR